MSFRKEDGENKLILQADLKDIPFWPLLTVKRDVFESEGTGWSKAICLTPPRSLVRSFIISWCAVRHLLSPVQNFHFQCDKGV